MSGARRILFIDRDGTLIRHAAGGRDDPLALPRLLPDVVPALRRLREAGYEFVMVSNQAGLGTATHPEAPFERVQSWLLDLLESQGIRFAGVHIDRHFPHESSTTRKPGIGMVLEYLRRGDLDLGASAMVGDSEVDSEFARNLGVRAFRVDPGHEDWATVAHLLADAPRIARVERVTHETRIRVDVDLDREARAEVQTGIGFFDHMLEQVGRHGGFALALTCAGDTHVDEHHTVEDSALALGQALRQALGDKRGLARYGFHLPMDEARAEALLDLSGRAHFEFRGRFPRDQVGGLPTELVPHFFRSLCDALGANLHLSVDGENTHHMVEACFKATARALRQALRREGSAVPSTKGTL